MVWVTEDGRVHRAYTDGNLGHVMSAVSALAKQVMGQAGTTMLLTSDVDLTRMEIERLVVEPMAFSLVMEAGPYTFTCHLDRDLEHILAGFGAAMRFFALKRGLVVVEDEVTRNAERAREVGLWTAPEGMA